MKNQRRIITAFLVFSVFIFLSIPAFGSAFSVNYSDLEPSDVDWEAIILLSQNGVFDGTGEGFFEPNIPMTREMYIVAIGRIWEMAGKSIEGTSKHTFSDVEENSWYEPYISWGSSCGLVKGYDDKTFGVGRAVTKEEEAVFRMRLINLLDIEIPAQGGEFGYYKDIELISPWALESVAELEARRLFIPDMKMDYLSEPLTYEYYASPQRAVPRREAARSMYLLVEYII